MTLARACVLYAARPALPCASEPCAESTAPDTDAQKPIPDPASGAFCEDQGEHLSALQRPPAKIQGALAWR